MVTSFLLVPLIDFFISVTLLYLYYFSGMRVSSYKTLAARAKYLSNHRIEEKGDDSISRYDYSTKSIERLMKSKMPIGSPKLKKYIESSSDSSFPRYSGAEMKSSILSSANSVNGRASVDPTKVQSSRHIHISQREISGRQSPRLEPIKNSFIN